MLLNRTYIDLKDYIIDLGLEFGLRSRLAVSNMNQLGTKNKGREGHFRHFARHTPLLSRWLPVKLPPIVSLSLSAVSIFFLLLSSSINIASKLNPIKISPPPTYYSSHSTSPTSWPPIWCELGWNSNKPAMFLAILDAELKLECVPQVCTCTSTLSCFNFL